MNKYIILYEPNKGLLSDYTIISGKTGVEALNKYLPDNYIGVVKRIRAWESEDYIIQKLEYKQGSNGLDWYRVGSRYGYKYHHPNIERIK